MKHRSDLIKYFTAFSNKNIDLLSKMFSDDIELVDWNISAKGKEKVIEANENIFDNVKKIQITPIKFYSNSDTSYSVQISISIDNAETFEVIDVIEFDHDGLISSVNAYKILNTNI